MSTRTHVPGVTMAAVVEPPSTITSVSRGLEPPSLDARVVEQLVLLAVSDEPRLPSSRHLLDDVDEVRFGRGARDVERRVTDGRRVLILRVPDPRMSIAHGRLVRGAAGWVLDDPESKNGAVVDGVLTRRTALADGARLELGHSFFLFRRGPIEDDAPLDVDGDALRTPAPALASFVGPLIERFAALARIAPTGVSVALRGETGTGKERVARALHELSGRGGPLVAINCGALPPTLIESELFGHRRGAFSGAVGDRPGLVRSADGGTLLLDEIGELPAASQAALLRVLQEREVVPVGDDRPVAVDVRVCTATLRDLEQLVAEGRFRADLHARLLGFALELPPLRERRADLGLLLRAVLAGIAGGEQARFAAPALRALIAYDWPFNIRELEKVLATAVTLAAGAPIELRHLPDALRGPRAVTAPVPVSAAAAAPPRLAEEDAVLRARLIELLTVHRGNVGVVADALGKRRMQVYRWARRFALDLEEFRR